MPAVIEVHTLHQKIVVIDEGIVLLGSLNALSQSHSREVMLVMEGEHFARKLLEHEQARAMANPPPACRRCGSNTIDLWRTKRQSWHWRCYAPPATLARTAEGPPAAGRPHCKIYRTFDDLCGGPGDFRTRAAAQADQAIALS